MRGSGSNRAVAASYLYGREEQLVRAVHMASEHFDAKRGVLAAWGVRVIRKANCRSYSCLPRSHNDEVVELERMATRRPDLIDRRMINPEQYFVELSKYRFLVAPFGNAVQSSKFAEAQLLLTIPIVRDWQSFRDLKMYGLPYVIVQSWDEINEANLTRWWAELAPRLVSARWLLTVQGIESLLYGTCWRNGA